MKRDHEQEEDLSELLQLLDDEAAGPSNVADNHWEPELEPKHTIFLSHSGVQKNFTEQLCVDLERWEYSPFFDKRPDSLPKGRKFPELIFQAAQQCRVAILVLSEDFFTRTKWPMLELEAFVQSQKENPGKLSILPVYLGLSRNECTRNETRRRHWLSVWRDWAQNEDRIDVGKWEDALKVLVPSNGIEYVESLGEVALRDQIVSAVRRLIPPESSWSIAHVQGRTRIVKAIIKKLMTTKLSPLYSIRVVGIYGMGGIGKTTFYKALCDELHVKFQGRVCHAKLGSKSPIELHKEVLRRLTDVNHDNLMFKTEAMLQALKAKSLIEDGGDGFHGVIVHDLYIEFAKSEVKRGALGGRRWVWYDKEVVYPADLARSPSGNCWSNVERIFVKYVDDEYDKTIRWMGTLEGMKWQHFSNVVVLQLSIGRNEVLDLRGLRCLKSMELMWGYDGFSGHKSGGQLLGLGELRNLAWLDMCNIHFAPCFHEIGQLTRLEVLRLDTNCFDESPLSEPLEPPNLDKCIQLQELVLLCTCLTSFPDLSKLTSLRKILFYGCKSAKEVVGLSSQMTSLQELLFFDCDSLSRCPGLSDVVSLQQIDVEGSSQLIEPLDLHKLTNLRRLNIRWNGFNKFLGLNESMQLQELIVCSFAIDELPNLHLLRRLQRLNMGNIKLTVMPWFDSFIALEELILNYLPEVKAIHGMRSLTRLKRLTIRDAPNLSQLPELGDLMALQYFNLHDCCSLVGKLELPVLHKLINLEVLEIAASPIKRLPSLERFAQLRELRCSRTLLAELPVLNGLDKLECIELSKCRALTSLEKVGTLPALIRLNCYSLTRLPDFRSSRSLEYLCFYHTGVSLGPEDIKALATLPALEMCGWDHVEVPLYELLEKVSLMEVVLHLEAKQLEYFTTLQTRTWTDPETWPEKHKYYRHPSHACYHSTAKQRRLALEALEARKRRPSRDV